MRIVRRLEGVRIARRLEGVTIMVTPSLVDTIVEQTKLNAK